MLPRQRARTGKGIRWRKVPRRPKSDTELERLWREWEQQRGERIITVLRNTVEHVLSGKNFPRSTYQGKETDDLVNDFFDKRRDAIVDAFRASRGYSIGNLRKVLELYFYRFFINEFIAKSPGTRLYSRLKECLEGNTEFAHMDGEAGSGWGLRAWCPNPPPRFQEPIDTLARRAAGLSRDLFAECFDPEDGTLTWYAPALERFLKRLFILTGALLDVAQIKDVASAYLGEVGVYEVVESGDEIVRGPDAEKWTKWTQIEREPKFDAGRTRDTAQSEVLLGERIEQLRPLADAVLRELSARARAVFLLYYVDGLSSGEAARRIDVSDQTILNDARAIRQTIGRVQSENALSRGDVRILYWMITQSLEADGNVAV